NELPVFEFRAVTPDFFRTLGMTLIEGRPFNEADRADALPVAIVDRTTAARFWPGQSPIGKRLGRPWLREWRTVVGVVGAVRNNQLRGELTPAFYLPFAQEPSTEAVVVVRTNAPLDRVVNDIRTIVRAVDATVPVSEVRTLDSLVAGAAARERAAALLVAAFAALAMLLGAVGLYGVLSYAVTQRKRELSVRIALGARPNDLLARVLRDGLRLGLLGLAIGIPSAWALAQLLRSLLHGVEPSDPVNFVMGALILIVTCTAAATLPAARAVRVQPASALR
ncbi:MAG TPA: FtsX-like permease family protein, partial [Longimicrobiales bacterium]|nr:FtsX-like permease family protein [Longimicrobiales bacterium]